MLNSQVKYAEPDFPYPSYDMETMGDRIKTLREARDLTQDKLGAAVGVTKGAVSQWENSGVADIKLKTFLKLVEVLRTDFQYLVFGAERSPGPPTRPVRKSG
jgi:transcriptional regulator with XRE-family HTH domain